MILTGGVWRHIFMAGYVIDRDAGDTTQHAGDLLNSLADFRYEDGTESGVRWRLNYLLGCTQADGVDGPGAQAPDPEAFIGMREAIATPGKDEKRRRCQP